MVHATPQRQDAVPFSRPAFGGKRYSRSPLPAATVLQRRVDKQVGELAPPGTIYDLSRHAGTDMQGRQPPARPCHTRAPRSCRPTISVVGGDRSGAQCSTSSAGLRRPGHRPPGCAHSRATPPGGPGFVITVRCRSEPAGRPSWSVTRVASAKRPSAASSITSKTRRNADPRPPSLTVKLASKFRSRSSTASASGTLCRATRAPGVSQVGQQVPATSSTAACPSTGPSAEGQAAAASVG